MSVLSRFNVSVSGPAGAPALVFAHGFGCDQTMWRLAAPAFEDRYRVVAFDHVGCGSSDRAGHDPVTFGSLARYYDLFNLAPRTWFVDASLGLQHGHAHDDIAVLTLHPTDT